MDTATLYEAAFAVTGVDRDLSHRIRPVWTGARLHGRALPVRTAPRDNLPLHIAVERAAPGDVLVVDAGGHASGYWGEILTVAAQARGIAGLVIDGGVRDTDRLAALGFPVFASAVAIGRTAKRHAGLVGEPIELDGRPVLPGDLVVADADGIVVIPAADEEAVLAAARARLAKETEVLERLAAGESTMDLYDLRGT